MPCKMSFPRRNLEDTIRILTWEKWQTIEGKYVSFTIDLLQMRTQPKCSLFTQDLAGAKMQGKRGNSGKIQRKVKRIANTSPSLIPNFCQGNFKITHGQNLGEQYYWAGLLVRFCESRNQAEIRKRFCKSISICHVFLQKAKLMQNPHHFGHAFSDKQSHEIDLPIHNFPEASSHQNLTSPLELSVCLLANCGDCLVPIVFP
jgi:hypothetical protein